MIVPFVFPGATAALARGRFSASPAGGFLGMQLKKSLTLGPRFGVHQCKEESRCSIVLV